MTTGTPRPRAGRGRRGLLGLVVASALFIPAALDAAPGAGAPRVVVLRAEADDALTRQATTLLMAELQAAGFDVLQVDRSGERDLRGDIEATSARLQPVATFAIRELEPSRPEGGGDAGAAVAGTPAMELWIEDRVTGKLVIRRVEVASAPEAAADLAVKGVELLHGSLLEVTVQPAAERPPPPEVTQWLRAMAPERRTTFARGLGLSAGAGALGSGDLGLTFAPVVRVGWGLESGYAGRLTATGLGSRAEVATDEGRALMRQTLVLAEALRVFRHGARLQPLAGVGAGVYHLRADGTGASALFPSRVARATSAALALQAGVALRLGDRVTLLLDANLLWLVPATRIVIGTREAARSGGPSLLVTAGVASAF